MLLVHLSLKNGCTCYNASVRVSIFVYTATDPSAEKKCRVTNLPRKISTENTASAKKKDFFFLNHGRWIVCCWLSVPREQDSIIIYQMLNIF